MTKEEAITQIKIIQAAYNHVRHSDEEWEALEMAKEALKGYVKEGDKIFTVENNKVFEEEVGTVKIRTRNSLFYQSEDEGVNCFTTSEAAEAVLKERGNSNV